MIWTTLRDSREENDHWLALAAALAQRLGPGHERTVAWFHQNKAIALERRGDLEDCTTEMSVALSLKRKALPPNHPDIAISLGTIAAVRAEMNDGESALAAAEEALDIYRHAYGNENPSLSTMLDDRGRAFRVLHRYEDAERDLRSAVTLFPTLAGGDQIWKADPLQDLGEVLVDDKKFREAVPVLESAIRILERTDPKKPELPESRFALARARWELHRDGEADLAMARAAVAAYRAASGFQSRIDKMGAWLADKPPGVTGGEKRRVLGRTTKPPSGTIE
jgi:tetratricopeptide (TPR) repeat protein